MNFQQLRRATNTNNVIESNIINFIGGFKDSEEEAFEIARVILNAMDAKYKSQDHVIEMIKTIAHQDLDSFGGVATYSFYLFTMDYCNDLLKRQKADNNTYELIKSIDNEIKIGKRALDMYLSRSMTKGPYVEQLFKTKNTIGVSNQYHDTLHDLTTKQKERIVKFIIDVYASRTR